MSNSSPTHVGARKASEILNACGLSLPLKMNGKDLFKVCNEHGYSRYITSLSLLDISNTTGRTISLSDEYEVTIDRNFKVLINRVIPVKK